MRIIYGCIAGALWVWFLSYLVEQGFNPSTEWIYMTTVIIAAGAMVGGDK